MPRLMPKTDRLPYALYRAEQVRALDACAIERFQIPGDILMERAGAALWRLIERDWPGATRITVLAGPGNNGGDGYVVARLALRAGRRVRLVALGDHSRLRGAAAMAAASYVAAGGAMRAWPDWPEDGDLIVDALLGTGLGRAVDGDMAAAIARANAGRAPVLAVDVPSGLCADTGNILGVAIRASATLSFIGLKQGLFTGDAPDCTGRILFDALDVPAAVYASEVAAARRTDWVKESARIPRRARTAHKGRCGHLLVVGGAPGMSGAARLAGEAALRAGAGLVTIATHPAHAALLNLTRPELMVAAVSSPDQLAPLLERATVIALGPGLGRDEWGQALFDRLMDDGVIARCPLVLDADALNLLAEQPIRRDQWILTPHPGEAARLLDCSTGEIAQDRFAAVAALQQRFGGVAVLKGAGTLILGAGQSAPALCSAGNAGMASGGMGDALTGIIGGLLAQVLGQQRTGGAGDNPSREADLDQAATAGVCLHAAAADWAAREGERGLLASDLIQALRRQWRDADPAEQ